MEANPPELKSWYRRPLYIGLFAGGFFVFAVFVWYVITTYGYWKKIRNGDVVSLDGPWGFSYSGKPSSAMPYDREKLENGKFPYLGRQEPPITIVQFVDFKCPNTKAAAPVVKQIAAKYGYKVKVINRYFPIESLREGATYLADVAACAGEQGRYWPAHDYLLQKQDELKEPLASDFLSDFSFAVGVDENKLDECLKKESTKKKVNDDYFAGVGAGVRGTPTFFVNGVKVEGAVPFEVWDKYLANLK